MPEIVQKHLAVQDLSKLKIEELTPLTPEVISRQVHPVLTMVELSVRGRGLVLTSLLLLN